MTAANSAVNPPMQVMIVAAEIPSKKHSAAGHPGVAVYKKNTRQSMYTPAATMVAAWINAETGVGPSMASGNHTCSGNCALLPIAPMKISKPAKPAQGPSNAGLAMNWALRAAMSRVPATLQMARMPSMNPKSPMRLVRKAFLEASPAEGFSYQNPINK